MAKSETKTDTTLERSPSSLLSGYRLAGHLPSHQVLCFFHAPSHRLRNVLVSLR